MDCGCKWWTHTEIIRPSIKSECNQIMNLDNIEYGKCIKNHRISNGDSCLINDHSSFDVMFLMITDCLRENQNFISLNLCKKTI